MKCLDAIKGTDGSEIIATIATIQISKQSLRSLRVEWMYENTNFLWLTDEV